MVSHPVNTHPGESPRRAPWLALLVPLLCALLWWFLRPTSTTHLRGVRLGLSAADTRASFQAPSPGSWASEMTPEPSLRWQGPPGAPVSQATFEFHQGMLVAIRLRVAPGSPEAKGPKVEVTSARVIARKKEPSGEVTVSMISRSCPAHAAEVNRLLRGGS
ncbi:MAG: hypothetical protein RMJ98_07540 [Myxococcales bacterium]|nr:hypothetical protein [Polyangiaceae bacterium]MDW8249138.1 hypothetical protein [Myxococcales bacterium]